MPDQWDGRRGMERGTDKAEINGTEINSAGINGTEETAGTLKRPEL